MYNSVTVHFTYILVCSNKLEERVQLMASVQRIMYYLSTPMGVCHLCEHHLSVVSQFRIIGVAHQMCVASGSGER